MKRVGLTGGIATGKSHVRAVFEALGVPTIDADVLAHKAVAPGSAAFEAVKARFGPSVLDSAGGLDRRKLGSVVFADPQARKDLEGIIHPEVVEAIDRWFSSLDARVHPFAIADVPLLYEAGRERDYDVVIVTACELPTQIRRVMARDGISEGEAKQRIAAQLPIEEKVRRADHVIRTDGLLASTNAQVHEVYKRLSA
ncbi:MAG TPA: dephospho-CoA kinase [Vicinamibacterales bacterium]|nr:dephospho-CoA kinase [Vicinamibacterales bacterium]